MKKHNFQKFNFSNHSLIRAKQRLEEINKNDNELIIQSKLREMLNKISVHEFEDNNHYYFKIPNVFSTYIVVKKNNNLVITITKISDHKKIKII